MKHLHDAGVIHCNLTSAAVFVREQQRQVEAADRLEQVCSGAYL
jgi:hypothetical protein